jgi:hypothetical protein
VVVGEVIPLHVTFNVPPGETLEELALTLGPLVVGVGVATGVGVGVGVGIGLKPVCLIKADGTGTSPATPCGTYEIAESELFQIYHHGAGRHTAKSAFESLS